MVIITAGMIGVGKTTLTGKIAEHLHTKAFLNQSEKIQFYHCTIKIQSNMDFYFKSISSISVFQ